MPLLLLACTNVAAGCFQQAGPLNLVSSQPFTSTTSTTSTTTTGLPSAAIPEVGLAPDTTPAMRVLNGSNTTAPMAVVVPPEDEAAQPVVTTPRVKWVKNRAASVLWSSSLGDAAAFTDLPDNSLLQVQGPAELGRLPVHYYGDGLLRRPGDAWVDAGSVDQVDAPAPGEVPAVDALAAQPLPTWVQAHRATTLWSGPDQKAISLTDLPQWTFLKVAGLDRDGRILVDYACDYASRQPGVGWVDKAAVGPSGITGSWLPNDTATTLL